MRVRHEIQALLWISRVTDALSQHYKVRPQNSGIGTTLSTRTRVSTPVQSPATYAWEVPPPIPGSHMTVTVSRSCHISAGLIGTAVEGPMMTVICGPGAALVAWPVTGLFGPTSWAGLGAALVRRDSRCWPHCGGSRWANGPAAVPLCHRSLVGVCRI